ncbi:cytochrome c oxidase assembly protein [Flavisphingomonas formosensis]|uniref:cytochrome c oxidase assembly protein n=1 Tax=Flavisphingomonas formosensis TaxID=861534 RepID=UPI0012F8D416|nr:cytochrome c oxidase assembly protein [Sphingomonas formosensis]
MRALIRIMICAPLLSAAPAMAHVEASADEAAPGWTLDPWITLPLLTAVLLFAIGWKRLSVRSGRSKSWRGHAFLHVLGLATMAIALVSPLHEAGERSFALHMTEHELIMLVAAPLLVVGEPLALYLWAFPLPLRRAIGRLGSARPVVLLRRQLCEPVTATLLQAAALWLWHAPLLFDRALARPSWHIAQHLSFLVTALLFWSAILGRRGSGSRLSAHRAVAVLCLFATSVVSGALGALMALSQSPWYSGYAALGMAPFGLTPAQDQQIAGLLMWVPGGLVHAGAALLLVRTILRQQSAAEAADAV